MTASSGKGLIPRSISRLTVDEQIEYLSKRRLSEVVMVSEGNTPRIGPDSRNAKNAAAFLVCRLFTDAIFSNDIRAIQLIINRIDGGLPKDTEVGVYRTLFSDCMNEVLLMPLDDRFKPLPDDTVMLALCKSLYAIAVQDVYWDPRRMERRRRAPTDLKQERDAAMRMILDRIGGRRTLTVESTVQEEIGEADWISSLPSADV